GSIGPNVIDSALVVMVPVSDEKAFLGLFENYDIKPEKGADNVYTMNVPGLPIQAYLRFANKYAYLALPDKDAVNKDRLPEPAKVFEAKQTELMSARIQMDQFPDGLKQVGLGQIELRLTNLQDEKVEGETEAQHAVRVAALKEVMEGIKLVINEGGEV